jgi:hypothetical protein
VARGVRGRTGKGAATMTSFASGELTAFVKTHRDLHTMKDFECLRLREGLAGDVLRFTGASAAAELVLAHTEQEPNPGLFAALELALDEIERVDAAERAGAVLCALWTLTEAAGPRMGPGARGQLRQLLDGRRPPDLSHTRQHLSLLADFLQYHVVPKPLKSMRFLAGLLPEEAPMAS